MRLLNLLRPCQTIHSVLTRELCLYGQVTPHQCHQSNRTNKRPRVLSLITSTLCWTLQRESVNTFATNLFNLNRHSACANLTENHSSKMARDPASDQLTDYKKTVKVSYYLYLSKILK